MPRDSPEFPNQHLRQIDKLCYVMLCYVVMSYVIIVHSNKQTNRGFNYIYTYILTVGHLKNEKFQEEKWN